MKSAHLLFSALLAAPLAAQTIRVNGLGAGSPSLRLEPGQAATRVFAGNFYQPGGTGGQVVANVNTFTGQPSYTVPLYTLGARAEIAFPFALSFSGPTFPTVENNNDRAPVGWLGIGWSMPTPFVAVNHKGTRTYSDDMIFCNLGPYGGGQILWQPRAKRYYLATAPGIVVTRDTVSNPASPLYRQVKAWTFSIPATGVRLVFGDAGSDTVVNSQRYLRHQGAMIVASPYSLDSSKPFIYRWDLRRMEDASGKSGLDFEYERIQEPLWEGMGYVRESYLKRASWRDSYGNEIRRVELELDTLQAGEYVGYFPSEAKTSQKPYETRYLKSLSVYDEGRLNVKYKLKRSVKSLTYGKKAVLDSIIPFHGPGERRGSGWSFSYRDGDQLLTRIVTPSGAKERFDYEAMNLEATGGVRDGRYAFRDSSGNIVTATNNGDGWWPETGCDDRFCHEILRTTTTNPDRVYIRVAYNTGNYFDTGAIVFQKTLSAHLTSAHEWQILPMGDHILIANTDSGTVELWEWDGVRFVLRNDAVGEPGDPMRGHFGVSGSGEHPDIQVVSGGSNYFLVHRTHEIGSLKKRIWVYLKDPLTGKWKNLTRGARGDSTCLFNNHPKPSAGGLYDPADGDSCFTWKATLRIAPSDRMFAVREEDENLLYWYALKQDGTGFDSIGQLIPQFPDGVQETSGGAISPQNWAHRINDMRFGPDYLVVKSATSSGNNDSRYDFLFYDGARVRRIGTLGWENDNSSRGANTAIGINHDRYVLTGSNYFIHANTRADGPKRVEFWRRRQSGDSIHFEKTAEFRNDIPREDNGDSRIVLGPRHFGVEYYPSEAFDDWAHPGKLPLTDESGNSQSWLYQINDTLGVDSVPSSSYSFAWGGCSRKTWNMSFSGLDNVLMGMTHRGNSGCACTDDCKIRNLSAKLNTHSAGMTLDTITDPVFSTPGEAFLRDRSWSFGARLGQAVYITHQSGPDTIWNRRYFFDGRTYSAPVIADVVSRFVREAVFDSVYPDEVTEFDFAPPNDAFVTVFNHNSLTPQFEYAKITRRGLRGATLYSQFVDHRGYRLLLDSAGLSGRVRCVTTLNGAGDTIAVQHTDYADPYSRGWSSPGSADTTVAGPWPQGVAVNRPKKTVVRQWSGNRAYQTLRTYPRAWSDTLETPLFTVTDQGNRYTVTQSILDTSGTRVLRSLTYDYPATDSAALSDSALRLHKATRLATDSVRNGIASSKVDYDPVFHHKVARTYGWGDPGGSWSDAQLKTGPVPNFNPDSGFFVASEVTKRDSLGQPLELLVEDGDAKGYTSIFYEGRAALPVGRVVGSRRDNVAVLTAENGSVPQLMAAGRLDHDRHWEAPMGTSFDSVNSHTGRYSFKVVDGFGPTVNLHLKDVRSGGFGFVASAWIRGGMSDAPVFSVSWRRGYDGHDMREVRATPVEGPYIRGRWQRWEAHIPHASLVADGMFADTANDYLRFFIGSIDTIPATDSTRFIHVDDIVLRPDNSVFSLTAYDVAGRLTQETDTYHRVVTREHGFAGQPTVTRDERGRVFSQGGFNKLGEN